MIAVVYCRFSPRPNAEECESIMRQAVRGHAYCVAQAYEAVATCFDREMSGGRADNRPGLQTAIELTCKAKGILVIYSIDRLARNVRDALEIADRLNKAGAQVAFLQEHVDTATPIGRCFFTIVAAFAELQRAQIRDRTRRAMLNHQANGRRMSDKVPYGWARHSTQPSLLVRDPEEQLAMVRLLQLSRAGLGLRAIGRRLREEGFVSRARGGVWYHSQVADCLIRLVGDKEICRLAEQPVSA